jgi:hypothetical protein
MKLPFFMKQKHRQHETRGIGNNDICRDTEHIFGEYDISGLTYHLDPYRYNA